MPPRLSRRKACDLCTFKRIRCDGIKPRCSNCRLYDEDCKITVEPNTMATQTQSSRAGKKAKKTMNAETTFPNLGANIEARLTRMEAFLQSQSPGNAQKQNGEANSPPEAIQSPPHEQKGDSVTLTTSSSQMPLPPISETMPVIEEYFEHLNSIIPLFQKDQFLRMLHQSSAHRTAAEWAAVNVVLALSYRLIQGRNLSDAQAANCVKNAMSRLTSLMFRTEDYLGLQTLLGLVLLHQGTPRAGQHRDTPMLMGLAARLVQIMRLDLRTENTSSTALPLPEILHRSRLFWIAYILDKDTSLRFRIPAILLDSNNNHVPPAKSPSDHGGDMYSTDGTTRMNFLHVRGQLAYIQGRVFDLLHSAHARGITAEERQRRVCLLESMHHTWRASIPPAFRPEAAGKLLSGHARQLMTVLFHTELLSIHVLNGLQWESFSMLARLRTRDVSVASAILEDSISRVGSLNTSLSDAQNPLPVGWQACVEHCRVCLQLSLSTERSEYYMWHDSCSSFAAGIILLVNLAEFPDHDKADLDQLLIDQNLYAFDRMIENGPEDSNTLRWDFENLKQRVKVAVQQQATHDSQDFVLEDGFFSSLEDSPWSLDPAGFNNFMDENLVVSQAEGLAILEPEQ